MCDGWCEQGGFVNSGIGPGNTGTLVTYLIPYIDNKYAVTLASSHEDTSNNTIGVHYGNMYYGCYWSSSKTTTQIRFRLQGTWRTGGYIDLATFQSLNS